MELKNITRIVARSMAQFGNENVQGTAFLVTPTHALSAAHCVRDETGRWASTVTLHFEELNEPNRTREAEVLIHGQSWDVAILALKGPPLTEVSPLPLASNGLNGGQWQTFAYPTQVGEDGLVFSGMIKNIKAKHHGKPVIQLELDRGDAKIMGASGAPIVANQQIIGLLTNQLLGFTDAGEVEAILGTVYALAFETIAELLQTTCRGLQLFDRGRQVVMDAQAVFEGTGIKVVDSTLFEPRAFPEDIERYYGGAPLTWDIVAAGGLITRELHAPLLAKLRTPTDRARMFCIVGDPGSGKSSLARQAVHALVAEGRGPILWFPNRKEDPWRRLEQFYHRIALPFYVFIDDVFRIDKNINMSLGDLLEQELDTHLPMTILATSRSNELRKRFPFPIEPIDLGKPTLAEKQEILRKLGRRWDDLNWQQRADLKEANSFLILMYQLTHGRGEEHLDEIIERMLENLEVRDKDVYEAYRYLCFTGQFEVSMPRSILERLVSEWRKKDLLKHKVSEGLIFEAEDFPGHLRTLHPVLAQRAFQVGGWKPSAFFYDLAHAIDPKNAAERSHFIALTLELARGPDRVRPADLLSGNEAILASLQQEATVREMTFWHTVFQSLGLRAEADRCADLAFTRTPTDFNDWRGLILLCLERCPPPGTFAKIQRLLQDTSGEWLYRSFYLRAVAKHAPEEIGAVLDDIHTWLAEHSEDFYVREHYVGQVRSRGSGKQVARALAQTASWLATQTSASLARTEMQIKADSQVRTAYLTLVQERGLDEQAVQALKETGTWLAANPDDQHVWQGYLGLAKRRGTPKQAERVLDETQDWLGLAKHEHDRAVRESFLALVRNQGTDQQAERVLDETQIWLARHEHDHAVRKGFLALVRNRGTDEQAAQALEDTRTWLATQASASSARTAEPIQADSQVRTAYLALVRDRGTDEQAAQALEDTGTWLAANPDDQLVWGVYRRLANQRGTLS